MECSLPVGVGLWSGWPIVPLYSQLACLEFYSDTFNYSLRFRIEELTCGGMVDSVRDAFAETMTSVVQLAARYPIACCNSIGLLCVVPYTRYV